MARGKSWLDWLLSEERRHARRHSSPPLVAYYYWDSGSSTAYQLKDVSTTGFYVLTDHRWYPGTVVAMTLQRIGTPPGDTERSILVNARVMRAGADGVGFEFVVPRKSQAGMHAMRELPAPVVDRKRLKKFLDSAKAPDGQALIEYILALPLLFLLILNVVNFGGFFYAWITLADAARAGANYYVLGSAAADNPATPTSTQVSNVITADTYSLNNPSSLVIDICQTSYNGTKVVTTTVKGTCSSIPNDPESTDYVLDYVSVQYTYKPFFAAFNFSALGVHLTIPTTTMTQTAVMRALD